MKWRVDIEYEDGSFTEPRRIAFQAIYDGEPYHGYDTKREALEAFCYGQIALNRLREEAEKGQHKINPCEPQTNREDMDFDTGQSYTWEQKEEQKPFEFCSDNRFEIIEKAKKHLLEATNIETSKDEMACLGSFLFRCWQMGWLKQYEQKKEEPKPIDHSRYCKTAIFDPSKPTIEERLAKIEEKTEKLWKSFYEGRWGKPLDERFDKIENRLTEIDGVLSSIGSPEWDLRKRVEAIETQTGKKNIEEINEVLEMVDKGKADTFYEQVNKIGKNDYKECKANPFRCEKCGLEFKVVSQERALVEHCPSCGDKPKRIKD